MNVTVPWEWGPNYSNFDPFQAKENARKAQNIHRKLKKKCWNSKATWSEDNEIAYNSQVFSFAFDCNVSPIDGYKKAHFLRDSD